jgi:hypothetical protein
VQAEIHYPRLAIAYSLLELAEGDLKRKCLIWLNF